MAQCQYCNKTFQDGCGMSSHLRHCKANPNWAEQTSWNRGKTKETDSRVKNNASNISLSTKGKKGKPCPEHVKLFLSETAKANGLGKGERHMLSKHQYVTNKGNLVWLQSSYEIKLAKILDELNIDWIRPEPLSWVDYENKSHKYYPDFKIEGYFLEPKNPYLCLKDRDKIQRASSQNNVKIVVLCLPDLTLSNIQNLVLGLPHTSFDLDS